MNKTEWYWLPSPSCLAVSSFTVSVKDGAKHCKWKPESSVSLLQNFFVNFMHSACKNVQLWIPGFLIKQESTVFQLETSVGKYCEHGLCRN